MLNSMWLIILATPLLLFSQHENKLSPPSDLSQINGVIYHFATAVQQHRPDHLAISLSDTIESINTIHSKKTVINTLEHFFDVSANRKLLNKWKSESPKQSLPANWDFQISTHTVIINGTTATATLDFFWIMDTDISKDNFIIFAGSRNRIRDTWKLQKKQGHWQIVRIEQLLSVLEQAN